MLFIKMFIKTLLITKFCQSLTIYEPRKSNSNITEYPTLETLNSSTMSKVMPYQQLSTSTPLNFPYPDYIHFYPNHYPYNHQRTVAHPQTIMNANEQPAVNASIESETLHDTSIKTNEEKPRQQQQQQQQQPQQGLSFVNYNNVIYHINTVKRASPWANNKQEEVHPKFLVRKQRNLNENHDDTNKLIEQNVEENIRNANEVNDQQFTRASSSSVASKQPSAATSGPTTATAAETSHEIRYLPDIFLNYPKSHQVNFGHVELSPNLFQKRFQSQNVGNRYRGEILWLDNTGGFAQHYWDLAQGRL